MNSIPTTCWLNLAPNPKSTYRQLFLKGTRIRAEVIWHLSIEPEAMTPEEIAEDYHLPIEAVREAIAYCATKPPEIAEDHRREELLMEATGMNDPDYKLGGRYRVLSSEERARLGL